MNNYYYSKKWLRILILQIRKGEDKIDKFGKFEIKLIPWIKLDWEVVTDNL